MPRLIALVTVVAFVDGERQTFPPGSELPELSNHDVAELKRMGSIEDLDETAAAEKADARADAKAGREFAAEKKAVAEALASTAPKKK